MVIFNTESERGPGIFGGYFGDWHKDLGDLIAVNSGEALSFGKLKWVSILLMEVGDLRKRDLKKYEYFFFFFKF